MTGHGWVRAAAAAFGTVLGAAGLAGDAAAQSLAIGVAAPVTSLDPHYHQLSPNNSAADMLFDRLVGLDAEGRLVPGLAESWHAVEPDLWEFRLQRNVTFHNGKPFTAEDVAFTFTRVPNVPNSPSSFSAYVRPIKAVEIVDDHTLRIRTHTPYPLLPMDFSNLRVLDRETHADPTTEAFNAGRLAVGTGPYRLVAHRQGDRIELERNDAYWGTAPAFARVTYRMITNDAARTAALLAGDVEFIDQVPTSDLARLRADQRLTLSERTGLRIIFIGFDQMRDGASPGVTDAEGRPLARNPLRDVRVRRALSMAIDRQAIVERIMEGAATPAGQFLPPGVFSHIPDRPAPAADPEGAKRLLAEAGFPQGFRLNLAGPNDRYVNDARIIQAIGQMWTRAGIRTTVEAQPWSAFVGRASRQEFSAYLLGWGSNPEGSHPLRNLVATYDTARGWGASNRGRYSSPELDRQLAAALQEMDDAKRERMLQEAQRFALDDVASVPLHWQTNIWAMRRGLQHTPRADELTRAQDVRPAAAR